MYHFTVILCALTECAFLHSALGSMVNENIRYAGWLEAHFFSSFWFSGTKATVRSIHRCRETVTEIPFSAMLQRTQRSEHSRELHVLCIVSPPDTRSLSKQTSFHIHAFEPVPRHEFTPLLCHCQQPYFTLTRENHHTRVAIS